MFQPSVLFDKGTAFYVNDYSDNIREAVVGLNLEFKDTVASCGDSEGHFIQKGHVYLVGEN